MMHDTTDRILVALFCLCRDTRPVDASALGQETGQTPTQAARALVALERAGWVDASRARLTMLGLARAAQLAARTGQSGGGPRRAAVSSRVQPEQLQQRSRIKPPVAARPKRAPAAAAAESVDRCGCGQEPLRQHVAGASVGQ
jgi:hypothetical protein